MELFLNILWLLIALAGLGVWCIDRAYGELRAPKKLLSECIALTCTLVFVFFAVSLSDDLLGSVTVFDDNAIERRDSLVWDCDHNSHHNAARPHVTSAAAPSQVLFSTNLQVVERILPAATHVVRNLKKTPSFGRSPPSLIS